MTTQSCSSPPPLPRPVSDAYPRQLDAEREAAMRTATHPGSEFDGAPAPLHDRLESLIDAGAAEMTTLMLDLAEHPEVAFEEHRSARAIVDVLAAHGIEAQLGVHGLDTAIRAEIGGGVPSSAGAGGTSEADDSHGAGDAGRDEPSTPTLAILSEYDALPGIGHGCGHNVIAVMGLGAFLRSEEHTSELQSRGHLVCRLLREKR